MNCRHCGYAIKADWIVCPKCGSAISNEVISRKSIGGKEMLPEEIECPGCSTDLKLTETERTERQFACLACKETFAVKNDGMTCPRCKAEFGEGIAK